MATDAEILQKAKDWEDDPRRPAKWKGWEITSVGATHADIRRLVDEGYTVVEFKDDRLTKYCLTPKGRSMVWSADMENKFQRPDRKSLMEAFDIIVGFEDIKETIIDALCGTRRIHILMTGPPACAKSVFLDCIRTAIPAPYSFMAFGSRTSASGLSQILFENRPRLLEMDEVDKMRHDCFSVMLGLMEKGEILETKIGKTRGVILQTQVIGACNHSDKFSPEFLSRFTFKPHFREYTRREFIEVCIGMISRAEGCPPDLAEMIGTEVFDSDLGDVRQARGVWQLMRAPTKEEVRRVIEMNEKYGPQNDVRRPKKIKASTRLPGM